MIVRLGAAWAKHINKWLDAEESQSRVSQRHKSKDHIVDSTDNCKPGIGRTDRELGFLDGFLDSISYDISDFTDPTVESTGCTDCTKPTDV